MSTVQIGVKRPHEVALISAIEKAIDDIAPDNMTPVEVLGVLQYVTIHFYNSEFLTID